MEIRNIEKEMERLMETIAICMQNAMKEDPEGSKTWTDEQLFEKGALWAGRHVLLAEEPDEIA